MRGIIFIGMYVSAGELSQKVLHRQDGVYNDKILVPFKDGINPWPYIEMALWPAAYFENYEALVKTT